jgi:glutamate N-acetyltransferase / amino-acid N-acetyltransferase
VAVRWPAGFRSSGVSAGIKGDARPDLGFLVADEPVIWAGAFTTNEAAAACVGWCKERVGGLARALVVNSGNANACTGVKGARAVEQTVEAFADRIGCSPEEVLVASTGPIGVRFPVELVLAALPEASASLEQDIEPFARSILTTDTRTKTATARAGDATIVGVAKGAAMLAPNMATMLAFVATDAEVEQEALQRETSEVVRRSFNRICVDACESTNDSVFVLASGRQQVDPSTFGKGLEEVCRSLAEQMARDAEGATKLLRIDIRGARDEESAVALGKALAASGLWRAAVHGGDPNWGRILAALGAAGEELDPYSVEVVIGKETVFARGEPTADLARASKEMSSEEVRVSCAVGTGPGAAEVLSSDLSPDYVTLNAWGTT